MKNIRNFTPHEINFYRRDDANYVSAIRKYVVKENVKPYLSIPSEGMLSIQFENVYEENSDFSVPICKKIVNKIDRVPETSENDILIVSAIYYSYRKYSDTCSCTLYTINDTVYNNDGKPIGCLGLTSGDIVF